MAAGAVVLLAAAGCAAPAGAGTGSSEPAPGPIPTDPAVAFAAAKVQLGTESARFSGDFGNDLSFGVGSFTGLAKAGTKTWEMTGKDYVFRRVGDDFYFRASGKMLEDLAMTAGVRAHVAAGAWLHLALLGPGHVPSLVSNDDFPWILANFAARATGTVRTGTHSFAGTLADDASPIDLAAGAPPSTKDETRVKIELDDRGRYTKFDIASAVPPSTTDMEFTFSDYGVHADISAPPSAEVIEEERTCCFFDEFGFPLDLIP